jgi:hypothetical protein
VAGFSQGKFRIERDPETGEPFVRTQRAEGIQILGAPATEVRASSLGLPLDEFVSQALGRAPRAGVAK